MQGVKPSEFAAFVAQGLRDASFTVIDIGCSYGIDEAWRCFGKRLRAFAFDPNIEEIRRLQASEENPNVHYVAAFVGVRKDSLDAPLLKSRRFWDHNPFPRTSAYRTLKLREPAIREMSPEQRTEMNLWTHVELADADNAVEVATFLRENDEGDVDFIKIDVDGPDFLILRSLESTLLESKVLGVGLEVNFYGSDDPDIHTFHNVDRFMRKQGFELFALTARPYSAAALPAPYELTIPAQTKWGRIVQGDALYFRDIVAADQSAFAASLSPEKILKLAALFSLSGLPDCAAEVLLRFKDSIVRHADVDRGLDILARQASGEGDPALPYPDYVAAFERDDRRFWPKIYETAERDELQRLQAELASMKLSKSWRLTKPLRLVGAALKKRRR